MNQCLSSDESTNYINDVIIKGSYPNQFDDKYGSNGNQGNKNNKCNSN
jgi:hypothetical protein